jgi:tetratricopeptide (TPR) repeat protein
VSNLASVLRDKGELFEAEGLYRRALDARERTLGADHADTLWSVNGLAQLLSDKGERRELNEAEALFQRALERRTTNLGADHVDTPGRYEGWPPCCSRRGISSRPS